MKRNQVGQIVHQNVMKTEFARKTEEELCDKIKSSYNINVLWMGNSKRKQESFVLFVELYSNKSVTSLKRTDVPVFPIQVNRLNV